MTNSDDPARYWPESPVVYIEIVILSYKTWPRLL